MTKRNSQIAAAAALILAAVALVLGIVFSSTGHATRALAADIALFVLLIIGLGVFWWGRRLKS